VKGKILNSNFCNFQKKNKIEKNLRISVAMCTYNGELFLPEQLESIARQTVLPNELIICDDNSTDATLRILKDFQEKAPFEIKIYRNISKLGSTKNFEKAISLCNENIIVLSDQDDVWLPYKIEKLEHIFKSNPDIGYVFSDAIVVDEKLFPLGYTMWKSILFTTYQRRLFRNGYQVEILLKHNVVTGATMAFRAEKRDWILPISNQWVHDAWIVLLLSVIEIKGDFIEEPLIKYRQHFTQLIGGRKLKLIEQFQKAIGTKSESYNVRAKRFEHMLDRLVLINKPTKKIKKLFEDKIKHLRARQWIHNHSRWKRFVRIFTELISGRYHRFSNGWKSVIKDLCL